MHKMDLFIVCRGESDADTTSMDFGFLVGVRSEQCNLDPCNELAAVKKHAGDPVLGAWSWDTDKSSRENAPLPGAGQAEEITDDHTSVPAPSDMLQSFAAETEVQTRGSQGNGHGLDTIACSVHSDPQ